MPDSTPSDPPSLHATAAAEAIRGRSTAALHAGATWEEACDGALAGLDSRVSATLGVVFIDSVFHPHYDEILARISDQLGGPPGGAQIIGCSGQAVIGPGVEAEHAPSIAILALEAPDATLFPLRIDPRATTPADYDLIEDSKATTWLLFSDPFSLNTENLVAGLQQRYPSLTVMGGMASAHDDHAGTAVFLDGQVHRDGAVMLGLLGIDVHPIVAQGAEPLGEPWTITDCEQNVVRTIGSRPAAEVLIETLGALDEVARRRAQENLLVGLAMDEYADTHTRGSFLIRNIMGANREEGWVAINAIPRVGQTLQFQFRDADAADIDLRKHLQEFKASFGDVEVLGAICCSCNGRGIGLFGTAHHDAAAIGDELAGVPTAGFFCNGEIGPVGGTNFLHGFTASIAILTATSPTDSSAGT